MRAMVLERPGSPLREAELPEPACGPDDVVLRVRACGVCRTDLHVADGELADPKLPLVLGHEIVGEVVRRGANVEGLPFGTRVGVPWLGGTCGICEACRAGRENLCSAAVFTGYLRDGGFAELVAADARFCLPIPECYSDVEAAPLLCAGLIGHRALRMAGRGKRLGLYGFGAAAHLIAQVAVSQRREVFAFVRPGDERAAAFALELGARWAGPSSALPPARLDAAIIFAPVGSLVPAALRALAPGSTVVCAGIHMSDIPSFPYRDLWMERQIRSVANLTREDGREFFELSGKFRLRPEVERVPLGRAQEALDRLRRGEVHGAAVLQP